MTLAPTSSHGGSSSSSGDAVSDLLWPNSSRTAHGSDDDFASNSLASYTQLLGGGTATWLQGGDVMSCVANSTGTGITNALLLPIPIAQGGYLETAIRMLHANTNQFFFAGLALSNGTAAGSTCVCNLFAEANTKDQGTVFSSSGTYATFIATNAGADVHYMTPVLHMRLIWQGANAWRFRYSTDGVSWSGLGIADTAVALTPTHCGLVCSTGANALDGVFSFEYLRFSG